MERTDSFPASRPEVADIFRLHGHTLTGITAEEQHIIDQIAACRTAALGGHALRCELCGYEEISYNSCRNRHCPKCQSLQQARWVEARKAELLPVGYFHVVFTIPECLNPVALYNKTVVYNILFQAVSETLKQVAANPKNLGAQIGFIAVLHTWDQRLNLHPHIHCIVPGGGFREGKSGWIRSPENYFLPIPILSAVFRGKFLQALEQAFAAGRLSFSGACSQLNDAQHFKELLVTSCRSNWVVYAKPPFAGPERVLRYLGRYTHRVAIGNRRILSVDQETVSFRYTDRKHQHQQRTMRLEVRVFMRRFLLHILPKGFVRIRHYGFLGNPAKGEALSRCRELLGEPCPERQAEPSPLESWQEFFKELTGQDARRCPHCRKGHLIVFEEIVPHKALAPGTEAA